MHAFLDTQKNFPGRVCGDREAELEKWARRHIGIVSVGVGAALVLAGVCVVAAEADAWVVREAGA